MSGYWQSCCCGVTDCKVKILDASATRLGHPVLHVTSGSNSSVIHLVKTIDYTEVGYDYHLTISVSEIKTGELTISETSSLPGGSTMATNRARAITNITAHFNILKNTASGTYGGITWTRTLLGVDVTGAAYVDAGATAETWSVVLSDEYTDAEFVAHIDDLRRNQDAGSGTGIAGAAENSLTAISWNETDIRGPLNYVIPDRTTLTAYESLSAPAIVLTVYSASAYWTATGVWWQHLGGGDFDTGYSCTFTDEATMPACGVSNDGLFEQQSMAVIRFNTNNDVCGTSEMEDNAGLTADVCYLATAASGVADWYSPDPISVSSQDFKRATGNHAFTAPGGLTSGACPCVAL